MARLNINVLEHVDVGVLFPPKPLVRYVEVKRKKQECSFARATVTVGHAGQLAGESIPVLIGVHHVKPVKCLRGCIVTLYRLSRFDMRSGEAVSFRKDLAQNISPLLIDPSTLSTTIKSTVRIPLDTFPTIANAPLVSFRYYIEVVLDLSGKITVREPAQKYNSTPSGFIETETLKRNKGVLNVQQEIIVGTACTKPSNPAKSPVRVLNENTPLVRAYTPPLQTIRLSSDTEEGAYMARAEDEKAAIREAEERLLPSAPLADQPTTVQPSAPILDGQPGADGGQPGPSTVDYDRPVGVDGDVNGEVNPVTDTDTDVELHGDDDLYAPLSGSHPHYTKADEARIHALRQKESAPAVDSATEPTAPAEHGFGEKENYLPVYEHNHRES